MKNSIIPEELSKSFAKTANNRTATEFGFKKWFAEIVFNYHPINNFIF